MHFVHVIEINDPRRPLLGVLSHEQVWRGLLRRVEHPGEFLPQLHGCTIVMRGDTTLARKLDFGSFTVRDRVSLEPIRQVVIDTDAAPNVAAARLTIVVETPSAESLQLRFTYAVDRERTADTQREDQYDRFLHSAYLQADIDSVNIIRQLANADVL